MREERPECTVGNAQLYGNPPSTRAYRLVASAKRVRRARAQLCTGHPPRCPHWSKEPHRGASGRALSRASPAQPPGWWAPAARSLIALRGEAIFSGADADGWPDMPRGSRPVICHRERRDSNQFNFRPHPCAVGLPQAGGMTCWPDTRRARRCVLKPPPVRASRPPSVVLLSCTPQLYSSLTNADE